MMVSKRYYFFIKANSELLPLHIINPSLYIDGKRLFPFSVSSYQCENNECIPEYIRFGMYSISVMSRNYEQVLKFIRKAQHCFENCHLHLCFDKYSPERYIIKELLPALVKCSAVRIIHTCGFINAAGEYLRDVNYSGILKLIDPQDFINDSVEDVRQIINDGKCAFFEFNDQHLTFADASRINKLVDCLKKDFCNATKRKDYVVLLTTYFKLPNYPVQMVPFSLNNNLDEILELSVAASNVYKLRRRHKAITEEQFILPYPLVHLHFTLPRFIGSHHAKEHIDFTTETFHPRL
uniref:Uncharacterized protein n=1 Tax=Ditylenchus dipsaci TaxID=166011 RepID=A0A915DIE5_9BILA